MPWVEIQNHVKIVTWICYYLPISSDISPDQGLGHVWRAIEDSLVSFQVDVDSEVCGADKDWRNDELDDDTGNAVCQASYLKWKILKNEKLSQLCNNLICVRTLYLGKIAKIPQHRMKHLRKKLLFLWRKKVEMTEDSCRGGRCWTELFPSHQRQSMIDRNQGEYTHCYLNQKWVDLTALSVQMEASPALDIEKQDKVF